MKKIFAALLVSSLSFSFFSVFAETGATTGATSSKADHFEVTIKSPVPVGEATDMVIKVVDKAGVLKKDYLGTIYVTVDNDTKATIPYAEDGYTFKNADQGTITFSKGLSFTKEGKMKVTVIDAEDDNLEGVASVTVTTGGASAVNPTNEVVTITTPDNNSEIPSNSLNITGAAKKNSKIQIILNGKQVGEAQTSEDGKFIYALKNIDQEQNVLQVKLLDGTDKIIGESAKVSFKTSTGGPVFNSLTIKEGKKVAVGTLLNITVSAEAKLREVSATLGESTGVFKETTDGVYAGTVLAPNMPGSFQIGVTIKNDLGKVTTREAVEVIEVTDLPVLFKNIKSEVAGKKVTFTFNLDTEPADLAKFKFQYGTESGTLSKEAITLDKSKILTKSGAYSWYIQDLDPQTKYFRILGLDATGKEISKMRPSDIFEVNLGLSVASKCMVSNVSNLKVTPGTDTTVISWDAAPDATSGYNVYKKGADGQYALIENVPTNSYIINVAGGGVKHDDFAVKGVCNSGEGESASYTEATNVKTGPTQLLILLGLSVLIGFMATRRKFAFFKGN